MGPRRKKCIFSKGAKIEKFFLCFWLQNYALHIFLIYLNVLKALNVKSLMIETFLLYHYIFFIKKNIGGKYGTDQTQIP